MFQRSVNHRMDVVLRWAEQLPQPRFLQLVLLRGADVEEGGDNVGESSKEGDSERQGQSRQNRQQSTKNLNQIFYNLESLQDHIRPSILYINEKGTMQCLLFYGDDEYKDKCKDKDKDRSSFRKMCAIDILYSLSFQDGPDQFNITHL